MRAYLKNGKSVRITQEQANQIIETKQDAENDSLVGRLKINNNICFYLDVDEVILIK